MSKSNRDNQNQQMEANVEGIPVLPLRDVVVYPYMVVPLFVGRTLSIQALETAMSKDKQILLVTQKNATDDQPTEAAIHDVGTLSTILQLLKLPDGTVKVLVEGVKRAKITRFIENKDYFLVDVGLLQDTLTDDREIEGFVHSLKSQFEQYVKLYRKIPNEIMSSILEIEDASRLCDTIAAHLNLRLDEKQKLLEIISLPERLEKLMVLLQTAIEILQLDKQIRSRVKRQMEKTQREYFLNEQLKAINTELNEIENIPNEFEVFAKRIKEAGIPKKESEEKLEQELRKLKGMAMQSAEATVSRNYLDTALSLPWNKKSEIKTDLADAEQILESGHYGLTDINERILEYLAVQQRVKQLKGPILCLVGPPGVGKTSLGKSIAQATGREFVRFSLGGVRDEAEIRGHRRTYIGAMPGKILQNLVKAKTNNPLFLLDEIDKMSFDYRGDPASALLEVLDPEQNHIFNDHYLELDFDLSDVMFVATANTLNIPPALKDRMEVIRIPGYTETEKVNIALRHLVPKQIELTGLMKHEINITKSAIADMIRYYTREAGVRNLEREISKLCRKVVKAVLTKSKTKKKTEIKKVVITADELEHYLGVKRFRYDVINDQNEVGQVKGLAWTEVGGELLSLEAATVAGKGKALSTGQLGGVMQESIQAALTVVKARAAKLGISKNFFEKHDIHIHVPEGATPKDGPSAGIGMCTALVSVITGYPVKADYAMTGEITLRGEVLPVGGIKEKLLAAHRSGVKHVLIPIENVKDLKEIPKEILSELDIKPVRWIDEVLSLTLQGYVPKKTKKVKKIKPSLVTPSEKKYKMRRSDRARVERTH